jgi:hypothetical protein
MALIPGAFKIRIVEHRLIEEIIFPIPVITPVAPALEVVIIPAINMAFCKLIINGYHFGYSSFLFYRTGCCNRPGICGRIGFGMCFFAATADRNPKEQEKEDRPVFFHSKDFSLPYQKLCPCGFYDPTC